nr:unnamed protein product [Spirometra erinaceieuropaei]
MYSVVEFFNDKSVAEVPEAWFYNAGSVLWPKKHRQRRILLENNQRPPDGTKAYAVKVLKSGLTLEKARQAARRALNTDNLSSSEPRQLGRGKRIRRIRELTSDSDDEVSPNQPREPSGWPAPPPILQHSTAISSYVSTATISTEFSQQVQKDMADIKGQLINTNVRLAALERRNDFLAEQLMALHSSVQQMQATLSDVVNALQRASSAVSVTSSSLNLPLCTEEAYENFLRRLSVEDGFANEAASAPHQCGHVINENYAKGPASSNIADPKQQLNNHIYYLRKRPRNHPCTNPMVNTTCDHTPDAPPSTTSSTTPVTIPATSPPTTVPTTISLAPTSSVNNSDVLSTTTTTSQPCGLDPRLSSLRSHLQNTQWLDRSLMNPLHRDW